jgi:hypothetical protein
MPEPAVRAIGRRGRDWVLGHFDARIGTEQMLRIYGEMTGRGEALPPVRPIDKMTAI